MRKITINCKWVVSSFKISRKPKQNNKKRYKKQYNLGN